MLCIHVRQQHCIVSCKSNIQHLPVPAHRVCRVRFKSYLHSHGLPHLAFVVFVKVCVTLLLPRRESCVTSTLLAFCCFVSYVTVGETGTDRITLMVKPFAAVHVTKRSSSIWMVRQRPLTKRYLTSGDEKGLKTCALWAEM